MANVDWPAQESRKYIGKRISRIDAPLKTTGAAKYSYDGYPASPGGSTHHVAALCSKDGRHLAIMPHIERSLYPWNWGYYPSNRKTDQVSPWIEAFTNAREWLKKAK